MALLQKPAVQWWLEENMWLPEKKRKPPVKITKVPLMDNSQTVQQEDSQPDIGVLEPAEPILDVFFCCSSSSAAESLGGSS